MRENFSERSIEESNEADRIPPKYRIPFQVEVLKMLIVDKMFDEKDMEQAKMYGKIISDFIDNRENVVVRELIMQKKFEEATEMMVAEIKKEKNRLKAA